MAGTGRIQLLNDHVINKIAAGEVVERPASVVKELVENALDAGARRIEIEVVAGGRQLIAVSDDGPGMTRDDALLSIERHATSKIRDVGDIEEIATLGFRGEALAAIASVSRFTLTTRTAADPGGTEIGVAGGPLQDVRDAGGPVGTRVVVRNLFFNVPARRKFLRSEQTEFGHVRQVFLVYALAHPDVGIRLVSDGRELFNLPPGGALRDRLRVLFTDSLAAAVRPVDHREQGMRLHGFAGLPQAARSDRSAQYVFVNGRPAGAPLIYRAIGEAYDNLLAKGRHPALFLFLDIDPGDVDVNVHPTKKEVRFRRAGAVGDLIVHGVRAALAPAAANPAPAPRAPEEPSPPPRVWSEPALRIDDLPDLRAFPYPRIKLESPEAGPAGDAAGTRDARDLEAVLPPSSPWGWCRIIGQVGGLFVLLETEEGLVLMDPRAAHERVLYERYLAAAGGTAVESQSLLVPETVILPADRADAVRDQLAMMRNMGFGVADFGGDTFLVDAVPACLGTVSAADLLAELAEASAPAGRRRAGNRLSAEQLARTASRAAVKTRDRLNLDEIEQLVRDLAGAEMPYTCPHGRPTLIFMSLAELNRKFGRRG